MIVSNITKTHSLPPKDCAIQMPISLNTKIPAKLFLYYERINERTETVLKKEILKHPFTIFPFIFTALLAYYCETFMLSQKLPASFCDNTSSFRVCIISPIFQQSFQTNHYAFHQKSTISYTLLPFRLIQSRKPPDFCVKVYFFLIVRFFPLSPSYQRHPKTQKLGSTTRRDEPHQALKPLILSHSSILLPASTQIPMASI